MDTNQAEVTPNENADLDALLSDLQIEENPQPTPGESSETEHPGQNTDFDNFLSDATRTKADERAEQQQATQRIDEQTAAELAAAGVQMYCDEISKKSGAPFELNPIMQRIVVIGFTPIVQKHAHKFINIGSSVDLDSWEPEIYAALTAAGISVPTLKHFKSLEIGPETKEQDTEHHGD